MAITLEQVNEVLSQRGADGVDQEMLHAALDYAMGVYSIPLSTLNTEAPAERLILGIALLASQAPFPQIAETTLKSSEVSMDGAGTVKETFNDTPTEAFPIIAGILAPFRIMGRTGISFGMSHR